jgi:hypothetical protein
MKLGMKIGLGIAVFIIVLIGLQLAGITWYRVFQPMKEDARREVYEETKSYTHGMTQTLAKHKYEWDTKPANRKAIESVIRSQYADFDASNIREEGLKSFLIRIRGY